MDKSAVLILIKKSYEKDEMGQHIPKETSREVFCYIGSIGRQEWQAAGQMGLSPKLVASIFEPEYDGEDLCSLDGERYSIYRTYSARNERLELYLEKKVGENA